jgi:uncharacterized protein
MASIMDRWSAMRFFPVRPEHQIGSVQYAALPWRCDADGAIEILLVTSRVTGRWIIPKGWPADDLPPHLSAAKEAWEEAGVLGEARPQSLGSFRHRKSVTRRLLTVNVYPLAVREQRDRWPERFQRQRRWFNPVDAAHAVAERPLRRIIQRFRPDGIAALEEGEQ